MRAKKQAQQHRRKSGNDDRKQQLIPRSADAGVARQREHGVGAEQALIGLPPHRHEIHGVKSRIRHNTREDARHAEVGLQKGGDESRARAGEHRRGDGEERMSRRRQADGNRRAENEAAVRREVGNVEDAVAQKQRQRDRRVQKAQLQGGLRDDEHGVALLSGFGPPTFVGGLPRCCFGSVLGGGHFHDGAHAVEAGILGLLADHSRGIGVDGDNAAVHEVVVLHAVHALGDGLVGEVSGLGAEVGVVHAAGGIGAVADEGVRAGVVRDAVDGKVTTLVGEDAGKSARTIANEELAKQLIPEGAKESLDTLQEIAAWIQNHPDDASAMNAAIDALKTKVGDIPDGATSTTVVAYIKELVDAEKVRATGAESGLDTRVNAVEAKLGDGEGSVSKQIEAAVKVETDARVAADSALDGKITAAKAAAGKAQGDVNALKNVVATKAAAADVTALTTRVTAAEKDVDDLQAAIASDGKVTVAIADAKAAGTTAQATANKNKSDLAALTATVGGHTTTLSAQGDRISALET